MRIYGRGIRRRLAPMVCGDRRRQEMIYSLLYSFPGAPVIRYGQEIGMGDDLSLPQRMGVRTPMQWSAEANAGFSPADGAPLVRPVIDEGPFAYRRVNVDRQRRDPDSLLNFFLRLIRTRKECRELGLGRMRVLESGEERIFAHQCEWKGGVTIAFHNLSGEPCDASYAFEEEDIPHLVDLLADRDYEPIQSPAGAFRMEPYGFRWMRIAPLRRWLILDEDATR